MMNPTSVFTLRTTPPTPNAAQSNSGVAASPQSLSGTFSHAETPDQEEEDEKLSLERVKIEEEEETSWSRDQYQVSNGGSDQADGVDEKTPLLLHNNASDPVGVRSRSVWSFPKHVASGIVGTFRVIISAILVPGRYIIACFYDDQGHFSAAMPFRRVGRKLSRTQTRREGPGISMPASAVPSNERLEHVLAERNLERRLSGLSNDPSLEEKTSALMTDSEHEGESSRQNNASNEDSPAHNTRSKATPGPGGEDAEVPPPKRSTRIKIVNQDELRRRKQRREQNASSSSNLSQEPPLTVATIKSPTSTASALRFARYPRTPAPPRPLVPRRQPSYSAIAPPPSGPLKTLIIDLDETLIHSMAKGGRMSTGHMVEVKLSTPVGLGGTVIGPQVPILYYVHKRPHCDEFLKKVSKWYNLIVFTASVQEYADPVIDWLEMERKYFSARYYRQHCTYRNGAYIKDLSQVEPDLSKVMILDNSPMSYIFHEDNAIPIEGWISDPTDNDLLHLIPLFEGLQHATDVRALLALRLGESV